MLTKLDKLHPDIIQDFRRNGKSKGLAPELQQYIIELDRVAEIHNVEFEHNISRVARKLVDSFPHLTFATARTRVYDAINLFHLNNTVKAEAWDNYYADRMEDLSRLSVSADKLEEARRCMERARDYRQNAAQLSIDPNLIQQNVVVINPDVNPSRLGLEDKPISALWAEAEEAIDKKIPGTPAEKRQAKKDAAMNLGVISYIEEYDE